MLKIFLIIITIILISGCHGDGNLIIEFTGENPLKVEFDDFGEIALLKNKLSIKTLNYGHYIFKISYPNGEFLILNLCHQNNWYNEKIIIEKSDKNKVIIHHRNQELDKVYVYKTNNNKVLSLGICG